MNGVFSETNTVNVSFCLLVMVKRLTAIETMVAFRRMVLMLVVAIVRITGIQIVAALLIMAVLTFNVVMRRVTPLVMILVIWKSTAGLVSFAIRINVSPLWRGSVLFGRKCCSHPLSVRCSNHWSGSSPRRLMLL